MIARFFLICICIGIFFSSSTSYANVQFTPAPEILMTGATSTARFDVTSALTQASISTPSPQLNTAQMQFQGAFYLPNIGWALLATGSYQVSLNCGSQALTALTTNCQLTGLGWSEMVGDLDFSHVQYIPSQGVLSGSINTNVGPIPLDGVYLPLRPAFFDQDLSQIVATGAMNLSVSNAGQYGTSSFGWTIQPSPQSAPLFGTLMTSMDGTFSSVDFSLADSYVVHITDPSGSKTDIDAKVIPGDLALSLVPGDASLVITTFCQNNSSSVLCPDGSTPNASYIGQTGTAPIADGQSFYTITFKPRDQYGNRVNTGTLTAAYNSAVSSVTIPDGINSVSSAYTSSFSGDALVFSGIVVMTPDYIGGWSGTMSLMGQDISYGVASVVPTTTTQTIQALAFNYLSPSNVTHAFSAPTPELSFSPAFSVSVSTPPLKVGGANPMNVTVSHSTTSALSGNAVIFFPIGDGTSARFRDFVGLNTPPDCQAFQNTLGDVVGAEQCAWYDLNASSNVLLSGHYGNMVLTGSYAPFGAYPVTSPVSYQSLVHYNFVPPSGFYMGSSDIVYPSGSGSLGSSEYRTGLIKILGQNNAQGEFGTIGTTIDTRTSFFTNLHKSIALLSRNRTDQYGNESYSITTGKDFTTDATTFANKKTIVVIGGNIHITKNIPATDHPLVLTALADQAGNGGDIIIDPSVTDINASLMAEHSILSSGNNQLYIYGSVISNNTLGDAAAHICPYYVTPACTTTADAKQYDLEEMRSDYIATPGTTATSLTAGTYPAIPLIIEYDMRIQSDHDSIFN